MTTKLLYSLMIILSIIGCTKDENKKPVFTEKENFLINNDRQELNSRVNLKNDTLDINPPEGGVKSTPGDTAKIKFVLKAEVFPPVYENDTLQASHVAVAGNYAFVTYNTQGEKYLGGLEMFDISNLDLPVIVWSGISAHTDLSSVDYQGSKVYVCGAWNADYNDYNLDRQAFLEVINLDDEMEIESVDTVICLDSYVGTDVVVEKNRIYTTSGSDGYFRAFDGNYGQLFNIQLNEARSVSYNKSYVCVLQGMPGRIHKYNKLDFRLYYDFIVGGANIPESKSELVVADGYLISALNEDGVIATSYSGSVLYQIPKPETPEGKDPRNYVSNSISLNCNYLLIANGGAGIYVAYVTSSKATMIGSIQFEDKTSTNFVESKDDVLFAATGKGGLKIVKVIK